MGKKRSRLNIDAIIESLLEIQHDFEEINQQLTVKREFPTDQLIQNMVAAYYFLDELVEDKVKIFSEHPEHILEMNHIVLCGKDELVRMEYGQHLMETTKRFNSLVKPILKWFKKHGKSSTYKVASQIYVGVLSQPQLFIEGNHRTGSLLASYVLLMRGKDPFVLSKKNALAYFEPSSQIKFANKRTFKGKFKLPKYEKAFKEFLEDNTKITAGAYVL